MTYHSWHHIKSKLKKEWLTPACIYVRGTLPWISLVAKYLTISSSHWRIQIARLITFAMYFNKVSESTMETVQGIIDKSPSILAMINISQDKH